MGKRAVRGGVCLWHAVAEYMECLLRIVKIYLSCNVRFLRYHGNGFDESGETGWQKAGRERKKMKKNVIKIMTMAVMLSAPVVYPSAAESVMAAESASARQSVKKYYVTADVLHVRSGPDTDASVIGSLTRGMEVKVISVKGEKGNRWAKIRFAGLTSYVSAKYLAKK